MLTINDTLDGFLHKLEIYGNTWQDSENLEDIRSVGTKVEGQELYKIDVVSCGKNLYKHTKNTQVVNGVTYTFNDDDTIQASGTAVNYTAYLELCNSEEFPLIGTYTFSGTSGVNINGSYYTCPKTYNFTSSDYYRFYVTTGVGNTNNNLYKPQIEEGTVKTPHEPYQEDKFTILSPTPLEKVGDVADRIVCKDGVYGVEKNIGNKIFVGEERWVKASKNEEGYFFAYLNVEDIQKVSAIQLLSNNFVNGFANSGFECFYKDSSSNQYLFIRIKSNKLVTADLAGLNDWFKNNPTTVKYVTTQPQFIPLPHDQQVKLRTFANKTHISFETEIQPTLKAQVPKSLGATVNTHTSQIDNLNKELDRVKKLEESTVSTVTTSKTFTTVSETNGGYLKDVKIEGKTLVNLSNLPSGDITIYNDIGKGRIAPLKQLTSSDTLYLTFNCTSINSDSDLGIIYSVSYKDDTPAEYKEIKNGKTVGCKEIKIIPKSDIQYICIFLHKNNSSSASATISDVMLMYEKDYDTQNPPSYFKRLKSVGQDTDEIEISSVNENLINLKDYTGNYNGVTVNIRDSIVTLNGKASSDIRLKFTNGYDFSSSPKGSWIDDTVDFIESGNVYCTTLKELGGTKEGEVVQSFRDNTHTSVISPSKSPASVSKNICYGIIFIGANAVVDNYSFGISLTKSNEVRQYQKPKQDKKEILYYNPTTQTWEKPVLREWDSIEKHSDGKYCYHERSGELVLNGSEEWEISNSYNQTTNQNNIYRFSLVMPNIFKSNDTVNIVSDRFISIVNTSWREISEHIESDATSKVHITISATKLSSQDVQGFKTWLQANPVTVVYQLAQEEVYECTDLDLITYPNETNLIVNSGAIQPKITLKVLSNVANVVKLLQEKVSVLESDINKYMISQNRSQLDATYKSDSVTFKIDYVNSSKNMTNDYSEDLYNLILDNILVGKDNYNYNHMFNLIMDYASWNKITWEQFDELVLLMDLQHNPIEELPEELN